MTETLFTQEDFAAKIGKLLSKAESCANIGNTGEAETFLAKAQELMTKYAIDQAMIEAASGIFTDEITQVSLHFTGNWRKELMDLAWHVASLNGCRGVQVKTTVKDEEGRKAVKVFPDGYGGYRSEVTDRKKAVKLTLTGFKSDLDRVVVLEASLRIQAMDAVIRFWEENKAKNEWRSYSQKVKIRSEFLDGFGDGVFNKLTAAKQTAKSEAIKSEAERSKTTVTEADSSVALVLRSREDRVGDWYDKKYGKLRAARRSYSKTVDYSATTAGYAAGAKANTSSNPSARQGARALA